MASQPMLGPSTQSFEAEKSAATLLIRHLPEAIPQDTLSRLFSSYGASSVRPCTSGRLRNCAFVDFKSEMLASQALHQLNGLRFLGKVLLVERGNEPSDNDKQKSEALFGKDLTKPASLIEDFTMARDLGEGLKSSSLPASEPIAARLGIDYPFPPHLEYAYPPPYGNILTNIVNALIAVPRFYVQEVDGKAYSPGPPRETKPGRKRVKREAIVGPGVDKDVAHVGVKPATLV